MKRIGHQIAPKVGATDALRSHWDQVAGIYMRVLSNPHFGIASRSQPASRLSTNLLTEGNRPVFINTFAAPASHKRAGRRSNRETSVPWWSRVATRDQRRVRLRPDIATAGWG